MNRRGIIIAVVVCVMAAAAWADVPALINYQGKLSDADGPVNGMKSMTFEFYNADADGDLLPLGSGFTENQDVTVSDGAFNVLIGSDTPGGVPEDIFDSADVYLSVTVEGEEQTPRRRVGSVPFAFKAANVAALEARVEALEALLARVSVSEDGNDIYVTAANLHILNGQDATGTANGLGNLIVGYNEERRDGTDARSGSHTVVVGSGNNYSAYGGIVAGYYNSVSGAYACVSGGTGNSANQAYASVSGGALNVAARQSASVSGGFKNTASGWASSVTGGETNTASEDAASVSGGWTNTASGTYSSVSGGEYNTASGSRSSVSGGNENIAGGEACSVSGGFQRQPGGAADWQGGFFWSDL